MKTDYFKNYSSALKRDMECKIYGHAGRPVLYIPCQDGRMQLGQWQDVFLVEFDPARERKVIITYYS